MIRSRKTLPSDPEKSDSGISVTIRRLAREPLFRLLAVNWLIGAFAALIVTVGLLALDTAGLRTLMTQSGHPVLPAVVLFCGLLITLSSAAMGAAIMAMPRDDRHDGGRGTRHSPEPAAHELRPALIPVRARARRSV